MSFDASASVSLVTWVRGSALAFATALVIATCASAQCDGWASGFGLPGVDGVVTSLASHDDGQGPALYLGGTFRIAGDVTARRIVRWDGASWSPLGPGLDFVPRVLVVHDDGSGRALYAGGVGAAGNDVARWDGSSWSPLGSGLDGDVYSMCVHNDGTGPALYVGGLFTSAGGLAASNVARWDGTIWTPLGAGTNSTVLALASFNDGAGPTLHAGGAFTSAGGAPANHVARWNGTSWSALAAGTNDLVQSFAVFDDGSGPALFVGQRHVSGIGSTGRLDKWNGASWASIASFHSYPGSDAASLAVHDDGSGPALYVGGGFIQVTDATTLVSISASRVARWDGTSWSALGNGLENAVVVLAVHDDGSGSALFAGGNLALAGDRAAAHVARWKASSWSALDERNDGFGTLAGSIAQVAALLPFDDGSGSALYAGGDFFAAGDEPAIGVARWDGASWSALGFPFSGPVRSLAAFDDGSGSALYAGGYYFVSGLPSIFGLARWNGSNWSLVGGPIPGGTSVLHAASSATGSGLYVGGTFTLAGIPGARRIARWNGTSWSSLASGIDDGSNYAAEVQAIVDWNASGPSIVAAGRFDAASGVVAHNIASWNGTGWSTLGSGLDQRAHALALFDDGRGPALYAGGEFVLAGGVPAARIARWDGASWSAVSGGVDGTVRALYVHDDGHGRALYAAGDFLSASGTPARRIARWDGTSWSALGQGVSPGTVRALSAFDDGQGAGRRLCAGGTFSLADEKPSSRFAIWSGCASSAPLSFCSGEEVDRTCPCANFGSPGRGCANSSHASGARLSTVHARDRATLEIEVDGLPPETIAVLITGASTRMPRLFGRGLFCIGDELHRAAVSTSAGGFSMLMRDLPGGEGEFVGSAASVPRYYQAVYRDPGLASCPASQSGAWNVTNAIAVGW